MRDYFRFRFYGPKIKASGLIEINPIILKLGRTLYFRIENKKPVEDLEVKSGYTQTLTYVSPEPFDNALKVRIYHIAWNSKVVLLVERYEVNELKLYKPLQDLCTFEEFKEKLEKLKDLPDDWTGSTTDWARHPIGIIESIINRLYQVEKIKMEASPTNSDIPFAKSALVLFILCTCIETIGRTNEFISFHDWLRSKRTSKEVRDIILQSKDEEDLKFLKNVYDEYLNLYGFRRAFNNFFKNLDKEWQDKLSRTVIVITNKPPAYKPISIGGLDNLIQYLEDFRNNFAHKMELIYEVSLERETSDSYKDEFDIRYEHTLIGSYQRTFSDGSFQTVLTRNLINQLIQAICFAIYNWILKKVNEA